ncbi:YtoQ family protein [Alphaproteobacteria bacterium]|nr:YtoQ family protein [Alphaproteobacteria bacterium]
MWKIYLSGEIHTNWRDEIMSQIDDLNLPIKFYNPITDHELSDNCGAKILGKEKEKFWHDNKSAKLNKIRTKVFIENADIVIIKFGDQYKQWNAAFDAGYAAALSKPLIIIHSHENQHALKEIDASALAITNNNDEVIKVLSYITKNN